jgi:hypothetical protein
MGATPKTIPNNKPLGAKADGQKRPTPVQTAKAAKQPKPQVSTLFQQPPAQGARAWFQNILTTHGPRIAGKVLRYGVEKYGAGTIQTLLTHQFGPKGARLMMPAAMEAATKVLNHAEKKISEASAPPPPPLWRQGAPSTTTNTQADYRKVVGDAGLGQSLAAPMAVSTRLSGRQPTIRNHISSRGQGITITHREYAAPAVFGEVGPTPGFFVKTYPLTPANGEIFPWLSGMTDRFERFRFDDVEIHFISESASTATGSVIVFYDPDPTDGNSAKVRTFQNCVGYRYSASDRPWVNNKLKIPSSVLNSLVGDGTYFLNAPLLEGSQVNVRTYSLTSADEIESTSANEAWTSSGLFGFGISQQSGGTANLGYFEISYKVTLYTPEFDQLTEDLTHVYQEEIQTGVNNTYVLGNTDALRTLWGNIALGGTFADSSFKFKRPGDYLVMAEFSGAGVNVDWPIFYGFAAPSATRLVARYTVIGVIPSQLHIFQVRVTSVGPYFDYDGKVTAGTIGSSYITVIDYSFDARGLYHA